ncbi:Alcohol dehydrogenase superfamily, zinc-type [Cynara cardunculus var. scolymus]|uniref:Alcohol dehydrogenase superfamily, zinc-type n=1 Tax=Cynara cardunculus var. scolymus TaxID=59895 RepID=A0A103Y3T5_CYNCS|nr:Alcohol dehydrogenase superfamily, zinc-type [Cynara cardunculus var. scolymus]
MGGGGGVAAATTVVESREWYLAAIAPENLPTSDHLKLRTVTVSLDYESIPDEQMALQLLLISVDPYLRSRITGRDNGIRDREGRVPGFTAWVGIKVIGNPDPGSNVFISAAAGGVGMFAGQLAKLKGCRVVGSTGSDEKNPAEREGLKNLLNIVGKEVKMEGFLCGSFLNRFGEFSQQMEKYMKEGKIKPKHKIDQGIESFFENFVSLFSSSNVGKVIIQVAS